MKKIYLIDGNSFIYRMFFALPEFATKDGEVVNALFGMAKFFVESLVKQNPDYLIFVKDAKGDNFRHDLYKDYKATRDRMPDNLRTQLKLIEEMIGTLGIDIVEIPGYEADDAIGTFAKTLGEDKNNEVYILSGDKDLYSLITENVFVYDTMKRKVFNPIKAEEKFGVKPVMIIDYLAIVGDKADNIPGIDGFGPKKAVDLINVIGSVEDIYGLIDNTFISFEKSEDGEEVDVKLVEKNIKKYLEENYGEENTKKIFSCFKGKTYEKLINSREDAILSKKLATIELNIDLEKMYLTDHEAGDGIKEKKFNLDDFKFKPEILKNEKSIAFFKKYEFHSLVGEADDVKLKTWGDLGLKVKIVDSADKLNDLFNLIKKQEQIVLDTETTSLDIMEAKLVGVSIYIDDDNIYYINRLHDGERILNSDLKNFLDNLLNLDILIIGHNIKYDLEIIELFRKNTNQDENVNNTGQLSFVL